MPRDYGEQTGIAQPVATDSMTALACKFQRRFKVLLGTWKDDNLVPMKADIFSRRQSPVHLGMWAMEVLYSSMW